MKPLRNALVLSFALLGHGALAQTLLEAPPAPGREPEEIPRANQAFYERRVAQATGDGLLARIARDRAARPAVYRELRRYYVETLEGNPRSAAGMHPPRTVRPEDLRPDMILPWCWLYLSPSTVPTAQRALQKLGGPLAVEAVRLQFEETFRLTLDGYSATSAQTRFLQDAVALAKDGGLNLVADEILRIRAFRKASPTKAQLDDPLDRLLKETYRPAQPDFERLADADRLIRAESRPERAAILKRLRGIWQPRKQIDTP